MLGKAWNKRECERILRFPKSDVEDSAVLTHDKVFSNMPACLNARLPISAFRSARPSSVPSCSNIIRA